MILYFTGTGNSRHLAAMLPQLIGDEDIMDRQGTSIRKNLSSL